ncbi:MAG: TRAP transporter small permease [Thermodesulfobacteriota bacterium]
MIKQIVSGIISIYQKTSAVIAGLALALICLSLLVQIIFRLVSLEGSGWTMDVIQAGMVWMTGAGGGFLASRNLLLKLDLFAPGKIKKVLIINLNLITGFVLVLAGARAAINNWDQTSPVLNIPMGANYLALVWVGIGIALSSMLFDRTRSEPVV